MNSTCMSPILFLAQSCQRQDVSADVGNDSMESFDHELCDDDPYGFFHQADEAWDHSDMCVSWSPVPTEHIQNLYLNPCMHI